MLSKLRVVNRVFSSSLMTWLHPENTVPWCFRLLLMVVRFSTGGASSAGKPCLTLAVTGTGKFNAQDEATLLEAKIKEEQPEDGSRTVVRIATPPEAYAPSQGRDVFGDCMAERVV